MVSKKIFILLLLFTLIALIFQSWLSFSIFRLADWGFWHSETLSEFKYLSTWSLGENSLGILNSTAWAYPRDFLASIFGLFGFDWNIADKFIILWPIVFLIPLACFLILEKIFKNSISIFIGTLYFSLNSYFLAIATQGHQFLTGGAIWGVFSFYFCMQLVEKKRVEWGILAGMMLAISGYYDFRMAYIFFFACAGFLFFSWLGEVRRGRKEDAWIATSSGTPPRKDGRDWIVRPDELRFGRASQSLAKTERSGARNIFWMSGVFVVVFVGLNIFWVLPFAVSGSLDDNAGVGRSLFGNSYFELDDAMYLSHPFWTGYGVKWFSDQPTPWWLSLLAIFAWVGFWVGRKNRFVLFFALVALVGILLGKQVSEPFPTLYNWLYETLPGFNAFREASKFYVLIALGYAVGIASLVDWLLCPDENVSDGLPKKTK